MESNSLLKSPHPPASDPEKSSAQTQGTPPRTDIAKRTTNPPASAEAPKDSPKLREKFWKWISARRSATLLGSVVFFLFAGVLAVGVIYNYRFNYATQQLSPDDNGVAILGEVTRFDWQDKSRVSITWSIVGRGVYEPQAVDGDSCGYIPANIAVDVYLNDASKPAFSYDPALLPVTETGARLCTRDLVSFEMEHTVAAFSQYWSPFDLSTFTAFVFVVESATNKSIPTTPFAVGDSGPVDFTTRSFARQVWNNFTYVTKDGPTTVVVESRAISIQVSHSIRALALTISMFVINWMMTLCSVVVAFIVFRRRGEVKDGLAFLPVTVILSTPTIRGLYVGSPPFGIFFDVVGFFPQMVTVVVCAMIVLGVFVMRTTRDRSITSEKVQDGTSVPTPTAV